MKLLKIIVLFLSFLSPSISFAQESTSVPERTPEQEAAKQTEKMQQELNLSSEQARQVHEINLKYARARKISNTRSDAIQRIRDKEVELSRVLNDYQQTVLQNKRYGRSSFQPSENRQGNQAVRPSFDNNPNMRSATEGDPQHRDYQNESDRSNDRYNGQGRSNSSTRQVAPRPVYTPDESRSSFRSSPENRAPSPRVSTPRETPASRSVPAQSSTRNSSTFQQPSTSGRR